MKHCHDEHCHCHDEEPMEFLPKVTPCDLKTEYKTNPLGMDEPSPRFSYQLFGTPAQTARQIQVFADGAKKPLWDTGWVEDGISQQIAYAGDALKPFTRYTWRVRVKDANGEVSDWSAEEAFFETGFLGTPWKESGWIMYRGGQRIGMFPQPFFKNFELPKGKKLSRARLYATALGCYEAEVNGTVVSWPMAPGWTQYASRVQYQAYDVTDLLKPGKNELWMTLAGGWYDGRIAAHWNGGICKFGKHEMLRAELRLDFQDGTTQTIGTNDSFQVIGLGGAIRMSDIYDGELYQAWRTKECALGMTAPLKAVRPEEQPEVEITWTSGAEVKRLQTLSPVKITRRCTGTYVLDFGQNFAGREILHLKNTTRGATITVKHGEMLNPDGSLYVANLRSAIATTTYVCDDAKEATYEPTFTFYGFRYLEISGWFGRMTKNDLEAVVLSSDLKRTGLFTCDNQLVNQLFDNVGWGLRSNLLDVPTDCPQRDERFGWTGDTQVICNAATYCLNAPDFYTKWIIDFNLDQVPTGEYPHVSPMPSPGYVNEYAPAWTDAAIVVPWQLYRKYGDKRLLEKYFDQMDKMIQNTIQKTNGTYIVEPPCYGDWLNINAETSKPYMGTAYLAGSTALLARIARVIGREKDAKRLTTQVKKLTAAFQAKFLDPKKGLKEKTQCAYLLALQFDLLPKEWVKKTVDALVKDIKVTRKLHLSTGFVGTPLLLPVLTRFGHSDLAYELLGQTTYPGWLYPVTQGATTMWERWNSYTHETGFGDVEMNSFNHYAYGAVAEWFFESVAGIQPIDEDPKAAAFKRFRLAPVIGKTMDNAFAAFCSPYGVISSTWERVNEEKKSHLVWNFAVPDNTTAEITLPKGTLKEFTGAAEFQHDDQGTLIALPGEYTLLFEE